MTRQLDLVVVGMGSGGTLAAEFAARDLGLRVAAVERARVGGDCLWTGCVPSKTLVAAGRTAHTVRGASEHGVVVDGSRVDLDAVWGRIHSVRAQIAADDDDPESFRALGIDLVEGTARVTGARQVTVATAEGERVLDTRYILICTGSRPTVPAVRGLASVPYLTNETLFDLDRPPPSVAVVGGGPGGVEIAQSLARLDVPTTVFEAAPRLLPRDEPELADRLTTVLRGDGVTVHTGSPVTDVERRAGGDAIEVRAGDTVARAAGVLLAAGRTANVEGLGLDRFGIEAGAAGITVDGRSRTIVPSIYAVGDAAAGRARFTHAAAHDAVIAVRDMFFPGRGLAAPLVPWCTFTDPELAHVGLTAAEARDKYGARAVAVHRHDLTDNDRARADGRTAGALIVVTAKRRIVGAHALAPAAGELIHELALAIRFGLGIDDLTELVHVYPTYATGVGLLGADHAFRRGRRYRAVAKLNRWLG